MILAIDTATRWAGLALHDGTAVIAEHGWRCLNNHTIEMTPAIDDMLKQAGVEPADLSGIAVAIGPGSYTGLRVGLALAKGLALANGLTAHRRADTGYCGRFLWSAGGSVCGGG